MSFLGVFGHVNIDNVVKLGRLPVPGTSQEVQERMHRLGGTAANIAVYSASLGTPTSLASFVGEDFPKDYRRALSRSGVDLSDLSVVKGGRTSVCFVLTDPHQGQMYFIDQGVFKELQKRPVLERTARGCDWIHISTGRPAYYLKVVRLAKKCGNRVALDPGQEIHFLYDRKNIKAILGYCDAFFGNVLEAEFAVRLLGGRGPEALLEHVEFAVVTNGRQGSRIYTKDGVVRIPALKVHETRDPTGAGDAYRAGFYSGLLRGADLRTCGLLGAAAASSAIRPGAGLAHPPGWEAVRRLAGLGQVLKKG